MIVTDHVFKVGDLVTRDGSDVQEVIEADDGYGAMTVRCLIAPRARWCKVGDVESNLVGRYQPVAGGGA